MGQRHFLSANRSGNEPDRATHAITFVASPVTQSQARHTAAAGVRRECAEQKEVSSRRNKLEMTGVQIKPGETGQPGSPIDSGNEHQREYAEPADDH